MKHNTEMSKQEQIMHRIGFLEGAIEGITFYAIWRNGRQLVGCLERPLKEVLQPYHDELGRLRNGIEAGQSQNSTAQLHE